MKGWSSFAGWSSKQYCVISGPIPSRRFGALADLSYSLPVVASKRVTDNLDKTVVLANVSNEDRTQVAFKIVQVKIEPNILLLLFLTPTGMLDLV